MPQLRRCLGGARLVRFLLGDAEGRGHDRRHDAAGADRIRADAEGSEFGDRLPYNSDHGVLDLPASTTLREKARRFGIGGLFHRIPGRTT